MTIGFAAGATGSYQRRPPVRGATGLILNSTGTARNRWITRWKAALNAFDITFDGRLPTACD
jgi:hypothetical protein